MKKKWFIYLAVLVVFLVALPLTAGALPGNSVTGVSITSSANGTVSCSESSGTWVPASKLNADTGNFTLTVDVTFLNGDDAAKAVYYDGRTMTGSSGTYSIGGLTQSEIATRKPITVFSGDNSYTTYVRAYFKSSDTGVTRVTFTLDPDDGTADQVVNLTNLSSTANLPNKDGTVSVVVTTTDSGASVSFIAPFGNPALSTTRTIDFTVTAEDGTTRNYSVTCQRLATLASDANLTNLTIAKTSSSWVVSSTLLNQNSPSTSTYTITNAGNYIKVTPTLSDTNATYVIKNGSTTVSTNSSANITVSSSGYTTVTVVVTAQNGTTTKTYTARVYSSTAGSSNADLSALKVSTSSSSTSSSYLVDLYPTFDNDTTTYSLYVPNDTTKVYVTPTTDDSDADYTINGSSSSKLVSLTSTSTSGNKAEVVVTAEDGTTKTYTLTIYRAASSASSDADLEGLELRTSSSSSTAISLNPKFDSDEESYTGNVDESQSTIRVYPTASSSKAVILVNGEKVTSGSYKQVSLSKTSTNTITVTVIAADYDTTHTYTVKVTRGDSSNNYLSALSVKNSSGTTVTISPTFKYSTTSYTASVANTVTQIAIKATTQDSNASLKINGDTEDSGDWSGYITLAVGSNSIPILVTADDGSKKTYYLTVTRAAGTTVSKTIKLTIGGSSAVVNGTVTTLDAAPFLYTYKSAGYTMVPIRFVSEQLGAKVDWISTTKTVVITMGTKTLTMKLGVANAAIGLDVAPIAKNGRTYVPLRYVSEQLGATVDWNSTTKAITITMK